MLSVKFLTHEYGEYVESRAVLSGEKSRQHQYHVVLIQLKPKVSVTLLV